MTTGNELNARVSEIAYVVKGLYKEGRLSDKNYALVRKCLLDIENLFQKEFRHGKIYRIASFLFECAVKLCRIKRGL